MITVLGKNYIQPENLKDCIEYLDKQKPEFTCLYFSAGWNPICKKIEKDYENFCNNNAEFHHIKVDCDATP